MLKGKNRLGVSLHSRRRLYEFHRRAEERGESLPAAITLGTHPLHYMGSMVYAYPPHVRKFEIIGGLFGEPYRLARCGIADLEVPAGAEIIIEGEILAGVQRAGRPVRRVHRLRVLPQHAERVRRPPHPHAPRRDVPQRRLGHVAGSHPGVLHHARGRNPQRAAAQPAQRARRARAAHDLRRVHGVHLDEEDRRRRAADGDHGDASAPSSTPSTSSWWTTTSTSSTSTT